MNTRGWGRHSSMIAIGVMFFGVLVYGVLVPRFGLMGAAVATLIVYSADTLVTLAVFCRLTGVSPLSILVPNRNRVR